MQQRLKAALTTTDRLRQGIVEAADTSVGGTPRRTHRPDARPPSLPGRGTQKTAVSGTMERGGHVVAEGAKALTGKALAPFLKAHGDGDTTLRMTDAYRGSQAVDSFMDRAVIAPEAPSVTGAIHPTTIERLWALRKRAWSGQPHPSSKLDRPLSVAETAWKYTARQTPNAFATFLRGVFAEATSAALCRLIQPVSVWAPLRSSCVVVRLRVWPLPHRRCRVLLWSVPPLDALEE